MPSVVNLKALGLNFQPNALDLPDGSLITASNIMIKRDNVIESRRGYKLSGESFGTSSDRAKQLIVYKDRILRHYSNILQFQDGVNNDGTDNYTNFAGTYEEVESGLRIKSIQSNGNLYITTAAGIKKISAKTGSDLSSASGFITNAGGVKAIDATASLIVTLGDQTSFFTQDSAVAYRIVWGTKDINGNLILGAPSQRLIVYNPMLDLIIQDLNRTLGGLDDAANSTSSQLLRDTDYTSTLAVQIDDSASTVRTNLLSLATKLDQDFKYADGSGTGGILTISTATISSGTVTVNFSTGTATDYFSTGSKIFVAGFTLTGGGTSTAANGGQTVVTVTSNTITFLTTNTTATGVTLATPTIVSNEYRSITQPITQDTPATHDELVSLQDYLEAILTRLSVEPSTGSLPVINSTARTTYLDVIDVTKAAQVSLSIDIPQDITSSYFLQIYRSAVTSAEGTAVLATDILPDDELKLVYEAFPTSAELAAGNMTVVDIVPDTFRGANLYTNAATGEGILQANDVPPLSKDLNRFKGYIFYANTKTRQRKLISLLGLSNMISDYEGGTTPKVFVSDGTTSNTYSFVTGRAEVTTATTVADVSGSLNNKYFDVYSGEDERKYRFFYNVVGSASSVSSVGIDVMAGVLIAQNDNATSVASKTVSVINRYPVDFLGTSSSSHFTVSCIKEGYTTDSSAGTSGFTMTTVTQGRGESSTNKEVLLSSSDSVAQGVDETARSLVRIINETSGGSIYAYYLSGSGDVPGSILLEGRSISSSKFYLLANNSNTGSSFNPDISPAHTITAISAANPSVVTSTSHGLTNLDDILVFNTNSTPVIDGIQTIAYISANTFSVPVNVTIAGNTGVFTVLTLAEASENEEKTGRLYYSKFQQPEAVPALNYIDVGANDQAIIRIFPLRDSLFVFKEDGLYRLSGEVAPFTVALFDGTCKLTAPDTVDTNNNLIYGLTTQGVSTVSESGVSTISRPVDTEILKLSTYSDFRTLSWGVGYESDNSYTLFTVTATGKEVSDIAYRYSNLTNTWTNFDKTDTCGIIHPSQDVMYLGCGDTNFIEVERKNFDRYDYADRELERTLSAGSYFGTTIHLSNVDDLDVGDVLVQDQLLTTYEFNMLLKKLDTDIGINDTNYYSTLVTTGGANLRTSIMDLATKLDADSGVTDTDYASTIATKTGSVSSISAAFPTIITSSSHGLISDRRVTFSGSNSDPSIDGTYTVTVIDGNTFSLPFNVTTPGNSGTWSTDDSSFLDIQACYNKIITKLNADVGVAFGNYSINDTEAVKETIITAINIATKKVTLNLSIDYIIGNMTVFKAIPTEVKWSPITMGDALSLKHMRESTLIFSSKAFTSATLAFSSDLLPEFIRIPFNGDGNGIFGSANGFGSGFFGGASNSAPFRTYIPRDKQRCRYLLAKFTHRIAREQYAIYGLSVTGEISSVRGYR